MNITRLAASASLRDYIIKLLIYRFDLIGWKATYFHHIFLVTSRGAMRYLHKGCLEGDK